MSAVDYRRILNRVDDVIQINVMTADQGDFLITHMPFEHLEVTGSGLAGAQARNMSEEQIYKDLIHDAKDEHRFIIVKGNNGTGKSHLIRWMQARMVNDQNNGELENEKIVFIRRIDNTLRGAISQLLEQKVVTDPEQLQRMQNFVDAATNMSESQLKDTILDSFISLLEYYAGEGKIQQINKPLAKSYVEFLRCAPVRQKMLAPHGPISRYYELINKPGQGSVNSGTPHFEATDFIFDRDKEFQKEILQYQGVSTIKSAMFNLSKNVNAQKLADVLNGFSETVIQRTTHIGGEDTTQIMIDLRKELRKQGKNLTIFIEDMTTFTGIDTELIKILVEGNTGTYSDFCRVTSVIGITNAYYDERFKDNFKDRVTHQVLVDDRSFGTPETLCSMAARYLNAFWMNAEEVQNWLQEGANQAAIPCKAEKPEYPWDSVRIADDDFTLYPFTKRALVELYQRLDQGNHTPRNFLRAIIREQMVTYLYNQMEGVPFPSVTKDAIGSAPISFANITYEPAFERMTENASDDEEKKAFRTLLCFWGNGTVSGDDQTLSGLPKAFVESLHFSFLDSGIEIQPGVVPAITPVQPDRTDGSGSQEGKTKTEFSATLLKQLDDIDQWSQRSDYILQQSSVYRKYIADFLHDAINWPMEGIPIYWVDMYLKDNKKVYIENQKEKVPTAETALILLQRNAETSYVLKGLAIRESLKDWNFDESAFYQQRIVIWLEKNRKQFISKLADQEKIESMKELLMASMTAEYLYLGIMGGFSRDEQRLKEKLFRQKNELLVDTRGPDDKRYDEWGKLISAVSVKTEENRFKDNKEILTRMIKSTTGEAQATSDNILVWGEMIDDALNSMKKLHWDFSSLLRNRSFGKDNRMESPFLLLQDYIPRVKAVLEDEKKNFKACCEKLLNYVPDPTDAESWKNVVEETGRFLKNINSLYGIAYPGEYDRALQRIKVRAATLAAIVKNGKTVCESDKLSTVMTFFSSDPINMELEKAIATFVEIQQFAEKQKVKYQSAIDNADQESSIYSEVQLTTARIAELMDKLSREGE